MTQLNEASSTQKTLPKVLFVDDDVNLLQGLRRGLRGDFTVEVSEGAEQGIAKIDAGGNYAVIVSDMRMPGMDGVDFLSTLTKKAPDPIRIMLTGNADQETAVEAVNKGHVFKFLNKPCDMELLKSTLHEAASVYNAKKIETDLLNKTLAGAVKVLLDVLEIANPTIFRRACAMRDVAENVARDLGSRKTWEVKIATLLSGVGWMSVPPHVLDKIVQNIDLTEQEMAFVSSQAEVGWELLKDVPRLEGAAEIIRFQGVSFDGSNGGTEHGISGEGIPLGARILNVLNAITPFGINAKCDMSVCRSLSLDDGKYDPLVVSAVNTYLQEHEEARAEDPPEVIEILPGRLLPGDVLDADLITDDGAMLLAAGQELSAMQIAKLRNHPKFQAATNTVRVLRI